MKVIDLVAENIFGVDSVTVCNREGTEIFFKN